MALDLEKKLNLVKNQPHLLNLVKTAAPFLTKFGLDGHVARTALGLDASGSMRDWYRSGQVQKLVNRAAAQAVLFDDDGQLDIFPFHTKGYDYGSAAPDQVVSVVEDMIAHTGYGRTYYEEMVAKVLQRYWPQHGWKMEPVVDNQPPVYLMFVTDGAPDSLKKAMDAFRVLSYRPCFVQTIALGHDYDSNAPQTPKKGGFLSGFFGASHEDELPGAFQFLMKLDDELKGYVDNFDFFGLDQPDSLRDEEFFGRMMGEYPDWLKNPKVLAMLGQPASQPAAAAGGRWS